MKPNNRSFILYFSLSLMIVQVSTPTVFQESFTYRYLYMISGMDNDGVDDILRQFQQDALPSQWLYSKDTTTPEGYHGIISEVYPFFSRLSLDPSRKGLLDLTQSIVLFYSPTH